MVVELGFGHSFGRTISILSLRRAGTVWKAISLGLERAKGTKVSAWADEHTDGVRVRAFDPKASAALEAVDFASAALSVKLSIPKKPGNGLGLSGWSSSGDFYVVVKVAGTTTAERHFAGYAGSDAQLKLMRPHPRRGGERGARWPRGSAGAPARRRRAPCPDLSLDRPRLPP